MGWTTVSDEPHALEVEWLAAWDSENADGGLIFWVDEEESGYIPWIDNDTQRVDTVRLGTPAVGSASTSGTLYLDDFVSHKSEYIGLNGEERSTMQEPGRDIQTLPASPARSQALRLPSRSARTPAVQTLEASSGEVSRTIDYTYDGLHRLTGANYDNGDYYAYSYDAVGNRLVLDSDANGNSIYLEYTYDNANRLATVGEVEYEWDDNGNLLDDGVNTYAYNSANRLLTVSGESLAASYGYNGLGERLEQMVNSQATEFVMDLNGGLSQVLDDGTYEYLYGNGRIAQLDTGTLDTGYFLGDALGSVRQLTDAAGAITLIRSFDPYGNVISSEGETESIYGYDGEQTDSYTKLVNLRSRIYDPNSGRFLTRNSWQVNYKSPLSLNAWIFAYDNPIMYIDPTGHYGSANVHPFSENVHFNVTVRAIMSLPIAQLIPAITKNVTARELAEKIGGMDSNTDFNQYHLVKPAHMSNFDIALVVTEMATEKHDINFFGMALHSLQDSFSHYSEGIVDDHSKFTIPAWLRRVDNIEVQEFFEGTAYICYTGNNCVEVKSPYGVHDFEKVANEIQNRNPNIGSVKDLDRNTMIDLYLRNDIDNPDLTQERSYFGFDTDRYIPGSTRDESMYQATVLATDHFLQEYLRYYCK